MNVMEHKAAIEAAVGAAEADGYTLLIYNACAGCCSDIEITLGNDAETVDVAL